MLRSQDASGRKAMAKRAAAISRTEPAVASGANHGPPDGSGDVLRAWAFRYCGGTTATSRVRSLTLPPSSMCWVHVKVSKPAFAP